jgi:hypothetical protein
MDDLIKRLLDSKQIIDRFNPKSGRHDVTGSFMSPTAALNLSIVKVQIPLETNEEEPRMLVYNSDRSVHKLMPVQERFAKELAGTFKGYYELLDVTPGAFKFGKRVDAQPW